MFVVVRSGGSWHGVNQSVSFISDLRGGVESLSGKIRVDRHCSSRIFTVCEWPSSQAHRIKLYSRVLCVSRANSNACLCLIIRRSRIPQPLVISFTKASTTRNYIDSSTPLTNTSYRLCQRERISLLVSSH